MPKIKPCYLKFIVIVHGKSEKQICDYIKSNLRIKMEVISEKSGEKSIQINGLNHILKDKRFSSLKNFINYFDDVEIVQEKTKKKLTPEFKIFIIMDTDDCSAEQREKFISKNMFKTHWAYEKKGVERKKEYIKIFPTDKKYSNREGVELTSFVENLKRVQETNLYDFVQCCLAVNDNKQ